MPFIGHLANRWQNLPKKYLDQLLEPCHLHKPSDNVAMHRLCGWALFSVIDHLKTQVKKSNKPSYVEQLTFANILKLASNDKHLLPPPVQYLDRGGMTFLRGELWPWMHKVEQKMAQHLNQASYSQYGSRLFQVPRNVRMSLLATSFYRHHMA